MKFEKLEDFYQVYDSHRTYVNAEIRKKHIRNYDEQIWYPAALMPSHSVLELGTGTGLFLAYLAAKGVHKFQGVDNDPKVIDYMPKSISKKVIIGDIWKTVDKLNNLFDRIVLLDVFEHFSYFEGHKLLKVLQNQLAEDGKIVLRIPNAASPFGLQYQYNDLTHKAVYGPGSIGHLALAAGFRVETCISVRRGNGFKRLMEKILLGVVGRMLTEPPPLWGANMIVVLTPQNQN
jgi:cyclopropane fatty-acyl-phospholipid synthase-like methyltransferase